MAEITNRRLGELVRGAFTILKNEPDGLKVSELIKRLEKAIPPTPFENSEYAKRPGVRRYGKIVRFGTVGCVKAGWLVKAKGRWTVTEDGAKALEKYRDPEEFFRESGRLYREWKKTRDDIEDHEPDMESRINSSTARSFSFEEAEEAAWSEIETQIREMDPYDFQNKLVPGLLKAMGFHVTWAAPPGPDGGIDIIAFPDPLGTKEPMLKVSVRKRLKEKADIKDIKELLSSLHGSQVGIFVSAWGFTAPAQKLAREESRRIRLLDLETVFELWVEHYSRIAEPERKLLALRPIWFLAPSEQES